MLLNKYADFCAFIPKTESEKGTTNYLVMIILTED